MKKIIETIERKAIGFFIEKGDLEEEDSRLSQEQIDINRQVEEAKKIREEKPEEYREIIAEIGKKSKVHKEKVRKHIQDKKILNQKIEKSKRDILKNLKKKKELAKEYISKNIKNIDIKALRDEERKLRNEEKLIRVTEEEFAKMTSEQQKIVAQAQTNYKKNSERLSEIRRMLYLARTFKNIGPEEMLKNVENAIEQVNNNFNIKNVDKLMIFKLEERTDNSDQRGKNNSNKNNVDQENSKEKQKSKDKVNMTKEQIENKINFNKTDILKYIKLINGKYKDDTEKYQTFLQAIKELEAENAKLSKLLNKESNEKDSKKQENRSKNMWRENNDDESKKGQQENKENASKHGKNEQQGNYTGENEKQDKANETSNSQATTMKQKKKYRPIIKFDRNTGNYTYIDEEGEKTIYDFFHESKENGGIFTEDKKEQITKIAMERGITKKQAKNIDFGVFIILFQKNQQLLVNYINSLKGNNRLDKGFDIEYDLRNREKKIKDSILRKGIAKTIRKAKKHQKLGIAIVYKDKIRTRLYNKLKALRISKIGRTTTKALNSANEQKEDIEAYSKELEDAIDKGINEKSENYVGKTDKFGNRVEKTDEEKQAETYERYTGQKYAQSDRNGAQR